MTRDSTNAPRYRSAADYVFVHMNNLSLLSLIRCLKCAAAQCLGCQVPLPCQLHRPVHAYLVHASVVEELTVGIKRPMASETISALRVRTHLRYRCYVWPCVQTGVSCQSYRFKPTLQQDMARADLVISHAGAGSIMEALGACNLLSGN